MTISNNKHLRTDLGVSVATHGAHVVHLFLVPDPIQHLVVNGVVTLCMHMPIQQKVNLHIYIYQISDNVTDSPVEKNNKTPDSVSLLIANHK